VRQDTNPATPTRSSGTSNVRRLARAPTSASQHCRAAPLTYLAPHALSAPAVSSARKLSVLARPVSARSETEKVDPGRTRQRTCRRRPLSIATSDRGTVRPGARARSALAAHVGTPSATRRRARRTRTGRGLVPQRAAAQTRLPTLRWRRLVAPRTPRVGRSGSTTSVVGLDPASSVALRTAGTRLRRQALRHDDSQACLERRLSTGRIGQIRGRTLGAAFAAV
jgi:hypothetical protein